MLAAPAEIGDTDFERLHGHGYGDEQIAEGVGLVSLQLLTGAFNVVAGIRPSRRGTGPRTSALVEPRWSRLAGVRTIPHDDARCD